MKQIYKLIMKETPHSMITMQGKKYLKERNLIVLLSG